MAKVVPLERWDIDAAYSPRMPPVDGMTVYARCAALLEAEADFDATAFRMSPAEAVATDPQQRLLLEAFAAVTKDAGETSRSTGNAPSFQ